MEIASFVVGLVFGLAAGIGAMLLVGWLRRREAREVAQELMAQSQAEKIEDLNRILDQLKDSFSSLSHETLKERAREFQEFADTRLKTEMETGKQTLEVKKQLIDKGIEAMTRELTRLHGIVEHLNESAREQSGKFDASLNRTIETIGKLDSTTGQLASALSGAQSRGLWGERMAEDILRLAGLIEGVNYVKQKATDESKNKPDYTFFLPDGFKINMDVKFPLANFRRFLEAESDPERKQFRSQFIKDVKDRIKEATTRDYISPEDKTVDYVLVFIPNEQVYAFIHESDSSILDMALGNRVVLCSPLTLYAVLAVIRQAVENFHLGQTTGKILSLLASFDRQWQLFVQSMDKMGKRLEEAQKEYENLTTTRSNQLDRQLRKIDELRKQENISLDSSAPDALMEGEPERENKNASPP